MEIGFFVLIGIGIAIFLYRDEKRSSAKEAAREASHMNLQAVEYQLQQFDEELKKVGVLGKKDRALMNALHSRRIDLLRQKK